VYEKAAFEVPDFGLFCPEDFMSFHSIKIVGIELRLLVISKIFDARS
jgi:hypothetical protein